MARERTLAEHAEAWWRNKATKSLPVILRNGRDVRDLGDWAFSDCPD